MRRVPAGRVLRAAALAGGVPALALLALLATGEVAAGPGLLALAACLLAALGLAWFWVGNLAWLAEALRRAEAGDWPAPAARDRPRWRQPEAPRPTAEGGGTDPRPGRAAGEEPPLPAAPSLPLLPPGMAEAAAGVSRLARRLAEREAQLGRMRRADAAILEALPDPLLVLAPDRTPLRANAAARAHFGVGGPDALGAPYRGEVAALLRHPALAEAVDRALAEGRPQRADLSLPVPVPREVAAQAIPLAPPLPGGGRVLLVLSDRSRERALERMRADFVANASHELRTPLASLAGFVETLRGPARDDPEAQARFLGIMAEQAERMRRLLDDLLGLSRIEMAEHQPPEGRAPLAAIARAEAAALEPLLQARRATLALALDEASVAAPADADQLAQVVRNLLENAVRHGREGGAVRLEVARSQGGEGLPARPGVVLAVSDDGPGIPREHIPRLTERFYRVDRGRSRAAGGTGLGLAIVKHIVSRHRGRLLIESEEGKGARFRVWLPTAGEG